MDKITQTIMENLQLFKNEFKDIQAWQRWDGEFYYPYAEMMTHLLQSQIKVIESVIEDMRKDMVRSDKIVTLEEQISSLNETLEFLKKSL